MHILLIVLGVLGGLAFWWYRLKMMGEAASEAADAIGRVRGRVRRNRIRRQNELSPLTAIDDPVVAAATLIAAIASEDVALSDERADQLRQEVEAIAASPASAEEAMTYAKWAVGQVDDTQVTIDKLGPFLATQLDEAEKNGLMQMARRVVTARGAALVSVEQRLRRMRQKLGLQVD